MHLPIRRFDAAVSMSMTTSPDGPPDRVISRTGTTEPFNESCFRTPTALRPSPCFSDVERSCHVRRWRPDWLVGHVKLELRNVDAKFARGGRPRLVSLCRDFHRQEPNLPPLLAVDCAVARDREDDCRRLPVPRQGDRHHLAGAGGDRRRRAGTAAIHCPLVRGEAEAPPLDWSRLQRGAQAAWRDEMLLWLEYRVRFTYTAASSRFAVHFNQLAIASTQLTEAESPGPSSPLGPREWFTVGGSQTGKFPSSSTQRTWSATDLASGGYLKAWGHRNRMNVPH